MVRESEERQKDSDEGRERGTERERVMKEGRGREREIVIKEERD